MGEENNNPNIKEKIRIARELSEKSTFNDVRPINPRVQDYEPQGYRLKFMQVITRHGRRTPESVRYPLELWSCNAFEHLIKDHHDKPVCSKGQLTVFGTRDLINVGRSYQRLLIDRLKFLSPTYSQQEIYIRSSDRERTISSARSLMHGLYGGGFAEEERAPRSSTYDIRPDNLENMYPRGSCERYSFLKSLLRKHPQVIQEQRDSGLDQFTKHVQKIFNKAKDEDAPFYMQGWRSYAGLVNSFDCFKNHGLPLPTGFTQDVIDRMYLEAAKEYKSVGLFPEMSILGIGRFIGDLSRQMTLKARDTDSKIQPLKFALYSAHDSTLASLLVAYKMYDDNKHPETASTLEYLLFEKIKDNNNQQNNNNQNNNNNQQQQFVKVIYNQKVLHMEECKSQEIDDMCPFEKFKEISDSLTPSNYESQCKISDEEKKRYQIALQKSY